MNVLIAEDDDSSRVLLKNILEKEGFTVTASCDGVKAWEKYNSSNISLVVLDWMMPEMDGLTVLQKIRAEEKSKGGKYAYILMLTAKDSTENIVEAMSIGADDYIKKPFDKNELLVRIRAGERILESRHKLKESEEKYRTLIENSIDPITVYDFGGNILLINSAGAKNLGGKPDDFINKSLYDLIPNMADIFAERIDQIVNSGVGADFEDVMELSSGKRWFLSNFQPVKDSDGKIFAVQIISQDITERKRAKERELKIKDAAIETSINPIIMTDVEGKLTYVNPSFLGMWRYDSIDEVTGMDISEFFKVEEDAKAVIGALREGGKWSGELIVKIKGGLYRDVQLSANIVKDETQNPIRMMFSLINITERKIAWNTLMKSEERYRVLTEASADAIFATNYDGRITYMNPALEKLCGIRSSNTLGTPFGKHFSKKASNQLEQIFNDLKNGKNIKTVELEIDHKDGSVVPIEVNASPLLKDGEFDGVECTIRDITERKRAEGEVKHANAELNRIFNTATDGMRVIDKDFNVLRANETFLKLAGISKDEALNKKCYEVFHGLLCNTPECPLTRIFGSEQFLECEVEKERTDCVKVPCILTATPFFGPDNKLVGIVEDFKDITEHKHAEEDLKKAATIIEAMVDGVTVTDMKGKIIFINHATTLQIGYTMKEVNEKTPAEVFIAKEDLPKFAKHLKELFFGKKIEAEAYRIKRKDGTEFRASLNLSILRDLDDEPSGIVAVHRDITIQEKLEDDLKNSYGKLQQAYAELQELDQMKTDFVSVVTHELRTPLAIMRNNIEMFLDGTFGDINEVQHEGMEMLFRNIEQLIKLVRDSLDMSRIYGGRLKILYEPVSIKEMFESVVADMKFVAEEKGHRLSLEFRGDIPMVECDRDKITQVLTNLLQNAIKFTPDGGKISVALQNGDAKKILVKVSDNGIGIPEEEHENIFKQFYEVGSYLQHGTGGTGLGLSISKGIIEAHGGKIWVESTPEKGSTFSFTIPEGGK